MAHFPILRKYSFFFLFCPLKIFLTPLCPQNFDAGTATVVTKHTQKNAPPNRPYLEGPSGSKTGFLFFSWPNVSFAKF